MGFKNICFGSWPILFPVIDLAVCLRLVDVFVITRTNRCYSSLWNQSVAGSEVAAI